MVSSASCGIVSFCLVSTTGELGPAICAGYFKAVFWFTFCYNEVNANCFYVMLFFKFYLYVEEGKKRGSGQVLIMANNMVLALLAKKKKKQITTDVSLDLCCFFYGNIFFVYYFFKYYLEPNLPCGRKILNFHSDIFAFTMKTCQSFSSVLSLF